MDAILKSYTGTVELLLNRGADIEAKTNDGLTGLILALSEGHTETAALLIDKGADITVTHNGKTAFILAKEKGYEGIAFKLCEKKLNKVNTGAQYFFGMAYENGEGVPKNNKEALKWYKLAAAQEYEDTKETVSRLSNVDVPPRRKKMIQT